MREIKMPLHEAWRILLPEIAAATVDIWTDEDIADEPTREQCRADIEAGAITPLVLDEIADKLDTCWCVGRVLRAALVVLAAHGRLDVHSETAVSLGRSIATTVINGTKYDTGSFREQARR